MNGNSRNTALLPLLLQNIRAEVALTIMSRRGVKRPLRLCTFASGSLLFGSSSFDRSVLEEGGKYREALQRRLASQDAPDCHESAATLH